MNLFEYDEEIMKCFDQETGELLDEEKLSALAMASAEHKERMIQMYKQANADYEMLKTEKRNLEARMKSKKSQAESIRRYLELGLNGQKFECPSGVCNWRKSSSVNVYDSVAFFDDERAKDYIKVELSPMKKELKDAIKNGGAFNGVMLEEKNNMSIK